MKHPLFIRACVLGAALSLSVCVQAQGIADDPDAPIATGEHWTSAQPNAKLAYLLGIVNMLEIEQALQVDTPPADNASLVPVMVRGLKDMTLNQIREALDGWYSDHPDQLSRPVMETIWFELAKPNS
ncbi:MAG: hypothetical protein R3F53_16195 [Gammaproteobacteria bacterium]